MTMDRPVIYVTTEYGPSEAERDLKDQGLVKVESGLLNYVDAYNETVGVAVSDTVDTIHADCNDLSSIDIAITKLTERIGRKGVLLVFDSLSTTYLFIGSEILRFMRQTLSRFAAKGNAVLACMDKGCGKPEDLVAMMTLSSGLIETELKEGKKVLNVVKHPRTDPARIEVPTTKANPIFDMKVWDQEMMRYFLESQQRGDLSKEFGELEVNGFWPNLGKWSTILWDPKRIPEMTYELFIEAGSMWRKMIPMWPWHWRLFFKLRMPRSFSRVRDMRKILKFVGQQFMKQRRMGIMEYLEDISKTDEHYFRLHEGYECWGFENEGTSLGVMKPAMMAGGFGGMEELVSGHERDWNAVETKCIGLGDPYCEIKLVPGEIDELKDSLEKDVSVLERIHDNLMQRLMGFLLHGKPLVERQTLGSDVYLHPVNVFDLNCREGDSGQNSEISVHSARDGT